MILSQALKSVKSSKVFKEFIKANPSYYLVHCFTMFKEGDREYKWELGYYSPEKDNLVVFEAGDEVVMKPEEEAFKREGTIKKLEAQKVKVTLGKALEACDELVKKKYPGQGVTQRIIIIQNLEQQVYNITLVTLGFNIINIRIDASTGKVLSDNIQSILSLGKRD
jgi:hypothetical protein